MEADIVLIDFIESPRFAARRAFLTIRLAQAAMGSAKKNRPNATTPKNIQPVSNNVRGSPNNKAPAAAGIAGPAKMQNRAPRI